MKDKVTPAVWVIIDDAVERATAAETLGHLKRRGFDPGFLKVLSMVLIDPQGSPVVSKEPPRPKTKVDAMNVEWRDVPTPKG